MVWGCGCLGSFVLVFGVVESGKWEVWGVGCGVKADGNSRADIMYSLEFWSGVCAAGM